MRALSKSLECWLRTFSKAVRNRDIAAGKKLFDRRVISFGTVFFRAEGLAELAEHQWQAVWPQTRDFDFEYDSATTMPEAARVVMAVNWSSTGFARGKKPVRRRGRATIVLKKAASGWKAVHTHFSIAPASEHDPVLHHARPPLHRPRVH